MLDRLEAGLLSVCLLPVWCVWFSAFFFCLLVPRCIEMFRKVYLPSKVSAYVLSYPQLFIAIPLLITFLISYSPLLSYSASYEASSTYLSRSVLETHENGNSSSDWGLLSYDYDYSLTKVIIQPDDGSNALTKPFLIESLAAQARIMHDLSNVTILHSPFDLWDNSIDALRKDRMPLATINRNLHRIPLFLFQGLVKVNGHVSFAKRLSFTVICPRDNTSTVASQLSSNIEEMNKIRNISNFYIFTSGPFTSLETSSSPVEILRFHISKLNALDYLLILAIYFLIGSFFFYNIEHLKSVKSRLGVSIAILAQLVLTVYSAKAITCLVFKTSSDNIPWFLVYIPVIFASLSSLFKTTMEKKGTVLIESESTSDETALKEDVPPYVASQKDFLITTVNSNNYTLRTTLSMLLLLVIVTPFSRKVSCFFIVSLLTNLFLQITYFSAVLSLDHRRFTYNELLALSNNGDDSTSDLNVSLDKGLDGNKRRSKWATCIELCSELNEWLPKTELLSPSSIATELYMFYLNTRFSSIRSSTSVLYKLFKGNLFSFFNMSTPFTRIVFDKRFIANELYRLSGSKTSVQNVLLNDPLIIIKHKAEGTSLENKTFEQISRSYNFSPLNTYKFDVYYFFEFMIFLVLIFVSTLLVLQLIVRKLDHYNLKLYEITLEERKNRHQRGEMKRSSSVSSVNSSTSSLSLADGQSDENVNAFHTKELSINGHELDIVNIATSQAPFVVSIALDHKVLVWSPLSKPMPPPTKIPLPSRFWPVVHCTLSNDGAYIAFFNNTGRIKCWSRKTMSFIWSIKLDSVESMLPLESFFRKKTIPGFMKRKGASNMATTQNKIGLERRGSVMSIKSIASVSSTQFGSSTPVDASYENFSYHATNDEVNAEFVFITAANMIHVIDYEGNLASHQITSSEYPLKSCKRLVTPRMNERLVLCDEVGELYVSTAVNNKWRTRKLQVIRDRFNKGQGLMTPRSLRMKAGGLMGNSISQETLNDENSSISTIQPSETDNTLLLVPFVGMAVKKNGHFVELIDVQCGILIKKVKIGEFKPGTLRVFHDQPTHCRFCGSASVATLSIAYTSLKNSLIMHSFQLESRTKTSICLRVERDPREIRCLGLESVVEKKHILSNVDRWDVTENNTLIGIRRKPELISANTNEQIASTSMSHTMSANEFDLDNNIHNRSKNSNQVKRLNSFKINNVWEGWTMNADGKVVFHEIPTGVNGLLVNRIGPLRKFGTKSIIVGFGNIMKMFYIGHEEFLLEADSVGVNEENSGLRFVNKRRERLVNKISTNYEVLTDSPT